MKKKILSLLLVFVMLTSMLPMNVFAADCTHSSVYSWTQTYDGRHSGYCYSCGTRVYGDCDTNGYASDSIGHYQACSVCGRKASTTATSHTWSYAVGSYGAGYHKQFCSVCNYVSTNNGSCSYYGQPYITENGQHWQVCSVCKLAGKKTTCSSISGAVSNDNGTHSITCSTCKVSDTVNCSYGGYEYSYYNGAAGHYKECSQCGHTTAVENHTLSYVKVGDSYHKSSCSVCGYATSSTRCSYTGQPYITENGQHWQVCSVCKMAGKKTDCDSIYGIQSNNNGKHSFTCDTCKHSVTESCDYSEYSQTSTTHAEECSECGHTKAAVNHDWTYTPYSTTSHTRACSVCNYVSYNTYSCTSETWLDDGDEHYKVCDDCGQEFSRNTHSGSVTKNVGDTHTVECSTCKKVATVDCSYGDWSNSSDTQHRKQCSVCYDYSYGDHGNFTYEYYYNGEHKKICGDCGDTDYVDCDFGPLVDNEDGKTHSRTCSLCEEVVTENHDNEFNYGTTRTCECGAVRHVHSWKVTGSGNKITLSCTDTVGVCSGELGELIITASNSGYNGEAKPATVTITEDSYLKDLYPNDYSYSIKYYVEEDGEYTSTLNTPTKAGKYKAEVTLTQNGSSATAYVEYEITKVALENVVNVTGYTGIYDGKSHGITVEAPDGVTVQYSTDGENWSSGYYANSFTDVCEETTVYYKATVGYYDEENYTTTSTTGSATVKIDPLDLATVLNVTAENTEFTYNRYDHITEGPYTYHSIKLDVDKTQVPGTYANITIEFSKDNGLTWSTQNPAFTDAGTYPVKYRIYVKDYSEDDYQDKNYIGITGEKKVTINKAELPFDELHGYEGPYDGYYHYVFGHVAYDENNWGYTYWTSYWWWLDDLTYEFSWTDDNGVAKTSTVTGKDNFISYYEGKIPAFKKQNVKDYRDDSETGKTVTVTISGKNYITETFTYNVKIGAGYAAAENTVVNYDGDTHYIKNYCPADATIKYKETGSSEWLPASQEPGRKDVGVTNVDWQVSFDSDKDGKVGGYDANGSEDANGIFNTFGTAEVITREGRNFVEVKAVALTVTAKDNTITYGEEPSDNGYEISGFVNGEDESVLEGTIAYDFASTAPYAVGTYADEIIPSGLTANNYSITFVRGDLIVEKKEIGLDWGTLVFDYDGTHKQPTVTATGLVEGDTCELTVELYEKDGTTPVTETKEIGEYTIKVVDISNPNYKLPEDVDANYSIVDNKAPVIEKIEDGKDYYGGTDFTVTDENLDKVTVDGKEVEPDENGNYNIPADNKEHTVVATDKSGNTTTVKVNVYKNYTVKYVASGKVISEQTVGYGKDAVPPTVPAIDGYYGKWNKDGKNITADTTITAVYTSNNGVAATGDDNNPLLWGGMMLTAAAGMVGIAMYLRKKKEEE